MDDVDDDPDTDSLAGGTGGGFCDTLVLRTSQYGHRRVVSTPGKLYPNE